MADYRYTGEVPRSTDGIGVWEPGETKTVDDPALCAFLDASSLHERVAAAPKGKSAPADVTQGNAEPEPTAPAAE